MTTDEAIQSIYDRSVKILNDQLERGTITQDEYVEQIAELDEWIYEITYNDL